MTRLNYSDDPRYRTPSIAVGSVLNRTYTYDPNGNVISVVNAGPLASDENAGLYTYQQATNKLTQVQGELNVVYGYDANGNTITANNRTFTYDLSNRLITVQDNSVTIAEYVYNGLNQRIKKILPGETRIFHYDLQGHMIAETNASGQTLVEYFYLGDQLLAMIRPGEAVYYYHNDHLGTPKILTDGNGSIAWKALYTPFGEAVVSIETVENPFRFPGQYYDQETGLHYNWNRYYDPKTGRYLTPDPIGLEGGINLFIYAANNPIRYTDIFGLANVDPPVIKAPPPDQPPIIKNPPPDYKPRSDPIPKDWHPPLPRTFCETKCYLGLFMDFYTCNIKWCMDYLEEDPHTTTCTEEKEHNEECKQDAYNKYKRCIKGCSN